MHAPLTHYPDGRPRQQFVVNVLQFFAYEHLPPDLRAVSESFCELAIKQADERPSCPELTAGLRKLLEAKDCMVRAAKLGRAALVTKDPPPDPPPPPPPSADGVA